MKPLKISTQNSRGSGNLIELKIKEKTAHIKANSIGYFMLNGHDTIAFPDCIKSGDFCQFYKFCADSWRWIFRIFNHNLYEARKYRPVDI